MGIGLCKAIKVARRCIAASNGDYDAVILRHDSDINNYHVHFNTVDGPYCAVVSREGGIAKCYKEGEAIRPSITEP